jgi:hypothetical protein
VCLDSTTVKVHPDGTGALKKEGSRQLEYPGADSPRRFIWLPHLTDRLSAFRSPAVQNTIRQEGMKLLFFTPACDCEQSLLMDRAYEGDNMRATAKELGYNPVVPPKKNRIDPWEYDEEL